MWRLPPEVVYEAKVAPPVPRASAGFFPDDFFEEDEAFDEEEREERAEPDWDFEAASTAALSEAYG